MRSVRRFQLTSLLSLLLAVPATAVVGPYVDLSNPGATPQDHSAAICTGDATTVDTQVDVQAHYSSNTVGSYGSFSACYKCATEGPYAGQVTACTSSSQRYAVQSKTDVTVTPGALHVYAGATEIFLDSGSTYAGSIAANTGEGSHDVSFTATIAESHSTVTTDRASTFATSGACSGGSVQATQEFVGSPVVSNPSGTETSTPTASYLVDLEAPTLEHTLESGSVAQNGTLFYDFTAKGGSASTDYNLKATVPSLSLESSDGPFSFDSGTDGVAGDAMQTVGLDVGCAAVGTDYESSGELDAVDLCGQSWGTITSGSSPTFDITSDPGCADQLNVEAVVSAPLLSDNYETVDCFTSKRGGRGKAKTVTDPGTVHAGIVVNMPDGAGDCSETASGIHMKITKDPDFVWTMSGGSPAIHVFVGDASGGFFLNSGYPLDDATHILLADGRISGGTDNNDDDILVDLSNLDVGCGAGKIPFGWTVYGRAHVRFDPTVHPGTDVPHTFGASAYGDSPLATQSGDYTIDENPTAPVCVNGKEII